MAAVRTLTLCIGLNALPPKKHRCCRYDLPRKDRGGAAWVGGLWETNVEFPWVLDLRQNSTIDLVIAPYAWADVKATWFPVDYESLFAVRQTEKREDLAPVVFFSSNCHNLRPSARTWWQSRMGLVEQLMALLGVDSYGTCLQNKFHPSVSQPIQNFSTVRNSKLKLVSAYKFMIVAENTELDDYVSEKIYWAFEAGVVPIYLGAPNIRDIWPVPHSFIHVRDYSGAAELAAEVQRLDRDDAAYTQYLEWRRSPDAAHILRMRQLSKSNWKWALCHACSLLHQRGGGFTPPRHMSHRPRL